MKVVMRISVEQNDAPGRLTRMIAPVISRLSECGHFLRLIGQPSEKGDGHGDSDFVTLFIPKIHADKALPVIVDEGAQIHGINAHGCEVSMGHPFNPSVDSESNLASGAPRSPGKCGGPL